MKVVYRLIGKGGGRWKALLLEDSNYHINIYEKDYEGLSGPKEANKFFSKYVETTLTDVKPSQITFLTGQERRNIRPYLPDKVFKSKALETKYTPGNRSNEDNLWTVSRYIWNDDRYDIHLQDRPEPPYTVYTDASYWPDKKSSVCSIGFIITGCNNNSFIMGCPANVSTGDNNVAEYYAVESALQFLPRDSEVNIMTDSKNVTNIMDNESSNPSFTEVYNLRSKVSNFDSVNIEYVNRDFTEFPDKLAEMSKWSPMLVGQFPKEVHSL